MESHTEEVLKESLETTLDKWLKKKENAASATTDNGANIVKTIPLFPLIRITCFGYVVNLAIQNVAKIADLREAIFKVRKTQNGLAHSSILWRDL